MRHRSLPLFRTLPLLVLLSLSHVSSSHAAQWRPIGPDGASIHALAAAPGGGRVYALTSRGRLYVSSDGAATWSRVFSNSPAFDKFVVDPSHPEILYGLTLFGGELAKSVDGGVTWSAPLLVGKLWTVRIAPSDSNVLYAVQDQTILKSTDGGASWTPTSFSGKQASVLAVDPSNPLVIYAGTPDGVLRSDDGGATWTTLQTSPRLAEDLVIDPRQPATLYELSYDGVFRSADRGVTWSSVWKSPAGAFIFPQRLAIDPASGTVYMLDPYNGVYSSTDGGATWAQILSLSGANDLAVDGQAPGRVYVGTEAGGVYRSDDRGGSWAAANHGFQDLGFPAVAADPHTPGVLFAIANPDPKASLAFGPQFLLRSTDGGVTWSSPFGGPDNSPFSNAIVADPSRPGTWYLATYGVLKTLDGGQTWKQANQGLRSIEFVYTLAVAPSSPDMLYAIGWDSFPLCNSPKCPRIVLFRSVDGGAQWRRARVPGLEPDSVLTSLAVDAIDPSLVYAGGLHVSKSTDGGVSWGPAAGHLRGLIESLAADPFTSGTLYASVYVTPRGRRVYKSTDAGATWRPASGGLPLDTRVHPIVPDPRAPGTLYAGTGRGVYVTRNGGALWTPMNEGWSGFVVSLALDPFRPGVLYAGGNDGLFEYSNDPAAAP